MLGIVAFWWLGDVGAEHERDCDASEDDATLVEGGGESGCRNAPRRLLFKLGMLFLGAATRLLLGALGTTARS